MDRIKTERTESYYLTLCERRRALWARGIEARAAGDFSRAYRCEKMALDITAHLNRMDACTPAELPARIGQVL